MGYAVLDKIKQSLGKVLPSDFRRKFSAWWEGDAYEPSAVVEVEGVAAVAEGLDEVTSVSESVLAMAVAQAVWGQGYLDPGSPSYYEDVARPLMLNKDMSAAYIGAGLGGPARDIVRAFDTWITGYEQDEGAISEGQRQNEMAGMAKKVTLNRYDPASPKFPKKKYQAVVASSVLHKLEKLSPFIDSVTLSLKGGGTFLFTDYVIKMDGLSEDKLEQLFPVGDQSAYWTHKNYSDAITDAGLALRFQDDLTETYMSLIQGANPLWSKLQSELEGESAFLKSAIYGAVGTEQAKWAARLDALKAGELAIYRYMAVKPAS